MSFDLTLEKNVELLGKRIENKRFQKELLKAAEYYSKEEHHLSDEEIITAIDLFTEHLTEHPEDIPDLTELDKGGRTRQAIRQSLHDFF